MEHAESTPRLALETTKALVMSPKKDETIVVCFHGFCVTFSEEIIRSGIQFSTSEK